MKQENRENFVPQIFVRTIRYNTFQWWNWRAPFLSWTNPELNCLQNQKPPFENTIYSVVSLLLEAVMHAITVSHKASL